MYHYSAGSPMTYGHRRSRGPRFIEAGTYGQAEVGLTGRVPWGLVFAVGGIWVGTQLLTTWMKVAARKKKA